MALSDTAIVRVLDLTPETGSNADVDRSVMPVEIWRGRLAQFEADNEMEDAACAALRSDLHLIGRSVTGGGASPMYVVELVSAGFTVTAIRSQRRARVFSFTNPVAAQIAAALCQNEGAAVVIVGPDGEYRSVINPTAPHRPAIAHVR
jgi:hypothetical protein